MAGNSTIKISAIHCQNLPTDPAHRLNNLELGGGALLDLGIYPISFAWDMLGPAERIAATGRLGETGADTEASVSMVHASGAVSTSTTTSRAAGPNTAHIVGTEGRIDIDATWYNPARFRLTNAAGEVVEEHVPAVEGRGMQYQAIAAERVVAGDTTALLLDLDESVAIMRALDDRLFVKAREQKEWTVLVEQYTELLSLLSGEAGSYDVHGVQEALKGLEAKGLISKKSRLALQAVLTELGLHASCSFTDEEYVALPELHAGVEYWHRTLSEQLLRLQEEPPDFADELYTLSRAAPCFQVMSLTKCHQFVLPAVTETLFHAQAFDFLMEMGDEIRLAKKDDEPLAIIDNNAIKTREKILFDYPATIKQESHALLDAVADLLVAHPEILLVEIQGHMESKGKDSVNLSLSQERADRVREFLEDAGVEPARLTAKGYGVTRPILCNKTEDCVGRSERIEFIILERAEESES